MWRREDGGFGVTLRQRVGNEKVSAGQPLSPGPWREECSNSLRSASSREVMTHGKLADQSICGEYGVKYIPHKVVVDKDGTVAPARWSESVARCAMGLPVRMLCCRRRCLLCANSWLRLRIVYHGVVQGCPLALEMDNSTYGCVEDAFGRMEDYSRHFRVLRGCSDMFCALFARRHFQDLLQPPCQVKHNGTGDIKAVVCDVKQA